MKNYIILFCLLCLTYSCSYKTKLEQSGDINVIIMETISMPTGNIGDTLSFKVFASTNDVIKRMEMTNKSHDFKAINDSIKFEMVGELSIDKDGYFSRDVKSLMVNYPVELTNVGVGDILSMNFTFTTNKGAMSSITAKMKVGNYIYYDEQKLLQAHPQSSNATQLRFYSSENHSTYGLNSSVLKKDSIDVFLITTSMYSPYPQKFVSPGSDLARTYLNKLIPKPVYDQTIMRKTKFVKVEQEWKDIGDEEIRALDFTQGLEEIDVDKSDRVGFLTADGRKGIILILGKTGFNASIQCKIQKSAE